MPEKSDVEITVVYRGENGDGWQPTSQRDLWNYAVRTGQVVVPPLDDMGPVDERFDAGDRITVAPPPEYAGRLKSVAPPPQPAYFEIGLDDE